MQLFVVVNKMWHVHLTIGHINVLFYLVSVTKVFFFISTNHRYIINYLYDFVLKRCLELF